MTDARGWAVFDDSRPVLTCRYSFGPGFATALAVGGAEGLLVVSPPAGASEAQFDALARHGPVRALVAPNAYHTMGLGPWKRRFPDAELFAPAQSIARVSRVTKLDGIRPLDALADLAGAHVRFVEMPHYRTGEALVEVDTARGVAWYVTDLVFNMPVLPPGLPGLVFRLSGSAPGLRFNRIAPLFMMRDRRAVWRWVRDRALERKPRWLIPAHGETLDLAAAPAALRGLLAQAD